MTPRSEAKKAKMGRPPGPKLIPIKVHENSALYLADVSGLPNDAPWSAVFDRIAERIKEGRQ